MKQRRVFVVAGILMVMFGLVACESLLDNRHAPTSPGEASSTADSMNFWTLGGDADYGWQIILGEQYLAVHIPEAGPWVVTYKTDYGNFAVPVGLVEPKWAMIGILEGDTVRDVVVIDVMLFFSGETFAGYDILAPRYLAPVSKGSQKQSAQSTLNTAFPMLNPITVMVPENGTPLEGWDGNVGVIDTVEEWNTFVSNNNGQTVSISCEGEAYVSTLGTDEPNSALDACLKRQLRSPDHTHRLLHEDHDIAPTCGSGCGGA